MRRLKERKLVAALTFVGKEFHIFGPWKSIETFLILVLQR